jgi:hypothetical protein
MFTENWNWGGDELTMHALISGFVQILYPSFLSFILYVRTQAFNILVCNGRPFNGLSIFYNLKW